MTEPVRQLSEAQKVIESVATEACEELFAEYGVALSPVPQEKVAGPVGFLLCSVVGFVGRQLRGSIVLAATTEPIHRSDPLKRTVVPTDWIGELCNQILGKMKSRLLGHGVEIYLNLPVVLKGDHLAPLPRQTLIPINFEANPGTVCLWVDIEIEDGFELATAADPARTGHKPGDTFLF